MTGGVGDVIFIIDCFAGPFPHGINMSVCFGFSLRLIRFPRKTHLLPGEYMMVAGTLEAKLKERAKESQHF